jgi:uncharacterized protein with von Willebrand factor type A (vWA) domain
MDPVGVARTPAGEAVDGRQLLAEAVTFSRMLRRAGLSIDLGAVIDFARAMTMIDLGVRDELRAAGSTVFVRRRDDREVYDRVFDRFWRRRTASWASEGPQPLRRPEDAGADGDGSMAPEPGGQQRAGQPEVQGTPVPTDGEGDDAEEDLDGTIIAPDAYSFGEVLRQREFDKMTPAELRDAERLVDVLTPRLETRRTRRYELHHRGRLLAPRAMFRRNLATGGQLTDWVWRRPVRHPRPLVVLCDISGSMERHSRLLLRFVQALTAANEVRVESFVFGTRLTRVTRLLRDRDRDRALRRVSAAVVDWAGGTRIGESFRDFNLRWARRTLRSSGIVIVVSDGWDRGDPALVATETARLRRNCHRLVWLNPLAGTPGYQPLAAGMRAAFPFIDDFLPAGTLASLERLGAILAGAGSPDVGRVGEAAAHVPVGVPPAGGAVRSLAPPAAIDHGPQDPSAARPLETGR